MCEHDETETTVKRGRVVTECVECHAVLGNDPCSDPNSCCVTCGRPAPYRYCSEGCALSSFTPEAPCSPSSPATAPAH